MSACAIVAWAARSALGRGEEAFRGGEAGGLAWTCVSRDEELASAGLLKPFCARAAIEDEERDRAVVLLEETLDAIATDLDHAVPGWRGMRVGLALGTSSGGMRTFERGGEPLEATYLGPLVSARRPCAFEPLAYVLGACASSTLALGLARQWVVDGACDLALAGGYDAVSVFVAAGFESLRATSTEAGPMPFRQGRDGLALGEGSALVALVRHDHVAARSARAWITGFGASCDAVHLTAPDRTGGGLARAAKAALAEADVPSIDLVSAHGTATAFNDAAESKAIAALFAESPRKPLVHALKGTIGHTLGAAGILETLAAVHALRSGVVPGSYGKGEIETGVRVLDRGERADVATSLKLASAFGGANAALVVARAARAPTSRPSPKTIGVTRAVAIGKDRVEAATEPALLAARSGYPEDRLARADRLTRLTIAAIADLADLLGGRDVLRGGGIVVGLGLATIETNALFLARIRAAGATMAEPRRFPFTTPNAGAGEAAIAFGLSGPAFAVGGGAHGGIEALSVAAALLRAGASKHIVVVAADEAGPASRRVSPETESGAVALLLTTGGNEPHATSVVGRLISASVRLEVAGPARGAPGPLDAHPALLPLAEGAPPDSLEVGSPWGGFAKARFFWL